ncbi:MAG: UDP-N-acetylglucosamine 1-carboxyvinyltransferase, partial [Anaerotignum sp.]
MEKFIVRQSEALHGTVRISGAKNAVLPILAACLLTEEPCTITNVPPLTDVLEMAELLKEFGAETSYDGLTETIKICSETLSNQQAAEKNACAMRASFLAAGPLLARCHQAALPLPGGCPIGSRPVDLHLKGFSIMGAVHKLEHGVVELSAKNGLRGKRVYLD